MASFGKATTQGKFYKGDGYMFKPLSYAAIGSEGDGD